MAPNIVFISYSSRDRQEAFAIKQLLEANQTKVWLDFFDIRTTVELRQELAARIRQANLFCLLLSPNAVASPWVHQEIETALAAAKDGLRILPIILRPCSIPAELDNIVGFDASDGLEHEAVRLRLVRAVCGEDTVKDQVLLDSAQRLLLANKEIRLRAEAELPSIADKIAPLAARPFRKVSLTIHPETLPENPNIILELRLVLDTLFHGAMSFFIAQYREGLTWPAEFDFKEPDFTEFFLTDRPRIDVQFKWFDRTIPLHPQIDGTDLKTLPAIFTLEFDGAEFKPRGDLNLPQVFEVPSLETLAKQNSHFELIAHDPSAKSASYVPAETDIEIDLVGEVEQQGLHLYRSRTTPVQRIVLGSDYLRGVPNAIRGEAILQRYLGSPPMIDRRAEIAAALEKSEFQSEEERRLAARFRFSAAVLARFRTLHRDAYKMFQEAAELLQPLVLERKPVLEDASLMYRSCRALVDIWLRQESFQQASQLANTLGAVAQGIKDSDPTNADYRRMWADTLLVNAQIHAKLANLASAATELAEHVKTLQQLHAELPTPARRMAMLQALTNAIQCATEWKIVDDVPVDEWKATLKAEVGESVTEQLTRPHSPEELPAWLQKSDPAGWPTQLVESDTLRYSLRIPKRWNPEPEMRGTAREIEHVYRGPRDNEWLSITFMDKANAESDMKNWVDTFISISGFPVVTGLKPPPELGRWNYLGRQPALAKKLHADEAHTYIGTARYSGAQAPTLGRLYIVMARRRNFAWKFALCFETACPDGTPEDRIAKQDHVRAGAILGSLRLDQAASSQATGN
jgi:hypothetical protein